MIAFNILIRDFNTKKAEPYDIMPYLIRRYKEELKRQIWYPLEKQPGTFEEFKEYVDTQCKIEYWSRCEYEWLMIGWPYGNIETLEECQKVINSFIKIDGYEQIKMNLDVITRVFMENIKEIKLSLKSYF